MLLAMSILPRSATLIRLWRCSDAQYKLEFLPVENDLLSLELDDVARDIYLVCLCIPLWSSLTY